jgi:hypothetical protein
MAFMKEDVPEAGPSALVEEHRTLVAWVKASRVGVIEYLRERMVDPDLPSALYYIEGLGMGNGQRFALVRGDAIYLASLWQGNARSGGGPFEGQVQEVSVPESAPMSRRAIEDLFADALGNYFEAHPHMRLMGVWAGTGKVPLDWSTARWVVRPRKYSLLYWRTKCARWWSEFRSRLWPRVWASMTSPLVAALSLAAFAWTGNRLGMTFAVAWMTLRLLQYERDLRLDAWVIGQVKYRHPLGHLRVLGHVLDPRPLTALKVRVEQVEGEPMTRIVRVVNRSWVPVVYVSLGAHALADLLAPGLLAQLRREAGPSGFDSKELERRFPAMTKKWLWPGQSFGSRHHLLDGFPLGTQSGQVEAVVDISRLVSGEPRSGAAVFLLEVEEAA